MENKSQKNYYKLINEKRKEPFFITKAKVNRIQKKFNVSIDVIYDYDLINIHKNNYQYELSELYIKQQKKKQAYLDIEQKTGKTREDIDKDFDAICKKYRYHVGFNNYYK